ncbi:MAG: hypothetical protein H0U95_06290 [Bacteroidetes bacterium]|nr:hypothetical protein [Bacteroidota bacterium]
MKTNNKILIICYSFPPHPGIGGRRWAKFSKLLSLKGYDVFVVGAENIYENASSWSKDINTAKIKLFSFNFNLQKIIKNPGSTFNKILRKFVVFGLNRTKYTPHIITSLPNKFVWKNVRKIISENNITKVIVSGDPYLFYYASLLKKEMDFELILDYRDLWNDHTFYDTNIKLSAKQKIFFELAENFAVNNCNKIIFVDEYLELVIKKRITSENVTTFVIHNGFDMDDLEKNPYDKGENDVINILFAGSISSDLNNSLVEFVAGFERVSKEKPTLYDKFSVSIFGEMDNSLAKEIVDFKLSNLHIENRTLEITDYYKQLRKSDVGLIILSEEYKNSFVTKFTDYLFYDKYIVVLGAKGYFNEYVLKQNMGLSFNVNDPETFFEDLLKSKNRSKISIKEKEKFDLDVLTKKLIDEVIQN